MQQTLYKIQQQKQNYWRDIQAAHIRQETANRLQGRFRHAIQSIADRIDELICHVYHVKRDQPADDNLAYYNERVELDNSGDQTQERLHDVSETH